jgi:lipoprotein-anchoring transpeptidase ErfK/SrfK
VRSGLYTAICVASSIACSSPTTSPPTSLDGAVVIDVSDAAPQLVEPTLAFPDDTTTLRLKRSVAVHFEPFGKSKRIGTIARDIRVRWKRVASGEGCAKPWVEIEPRGWVCGTYLAPTTQPVYGVELPKVRRGDVVPGVYGKVITKGAATYAKPEDVAEEIVKRTLAGSVKVRRERSVEHEGVVYWRIGRDEYLPAAAVRVLRPTRWGGVRLGDDTGLELPVAFALARRGHTKKVAVHTAAEGARVVRWLAPRTVVSALETASSRVRIGDGQWVDAVDLRVAELAAPPELTEPGERWVDVDLDRQVLVAYEGTQPVYATLVSSGAKKYPSETGIFRVWVKFSETDMNGQMGDEAPYAVATVPWTQFYAKDLALHTAYWHDKFGQPRSHGCINLSPVDARFLYFWSSPPLPAGWSMAHGIVERPGSMIRVRSEADPKPEFKGYAKRVQQARRARLSQ